MLHAMEIYLVEVACAIVVIPAFGATFIWFLFRHLDIKLEKEKCERTKSSSQKTP
jgi:hypothetical protein